MKPFIRKWLKSSILFKLIRFVKHYIIFKKNNDSRLKLKLKDIQLEIDDWGNVHPFNRDLVYLTYWAMRKLYLYQPEKHIDISSDIRFATLLSTFIKTEYYDIREINIQLPYLKTGIADLTQLPFKDNSIESISCMHVVEHLGLGRYGDVLNPNADLLAINEIVRVVKPGGKIFFMVPIGKPKIVFNAHRIYSYDQIQNYFSDLRQEEFVLIPDNPKDGHLIKNPSAKLIDEQRIGCGCWIFIKP